MPEKLKPCPFCGGEAKLVKISDKMGNLLIMGYKAKCSNCRCSPRPNNYTGNKQEAIEEWNRRAKDE